MQLAVLILCAANLVALIALAIKVVQQDSVPAAPAAEFDPQEIAEVLKHEVAPVSAAVQTMHSGIYEMMNYGQQSTATQLETLRSTFQTESQTQRVELSEYRQEQAASIAQSLDHITAELGKFRTESLNQYQEMARDNNAFQETSRRVLVESIDALKSANTADLEKIRTEVGDRLQRTLSNALKENAEQIQALTASNAQRHEEMRAMVTKELEAVRKDNAEQLEKMRATVDEKLQGTLEKRLGESFKLVSTQLEQVQRGLGEMQTLATDVGGLKRVLTNVKSRGTWGEVQLGRQLEDFLTSEQFEQNVRITETGGESVEFAVRLPGRGDDEKVYLPIDSKFPQEDFERLLEAQEAAATAAIDDASKKLIAAIRLQAKQISEKYIAPPRSTDFAIMYLPTEGLFAEVMRVPGLASDIQRQYRVMITGPTTLMSLLNSLQMGFRTLAIEKRSSEVWQILSAAKAEFEKYGQVWDKLNRQLETAQRTVQEAGVRTRAVERRLRHVETMELPEAEQDDLLQEIFPDELD